MSGKTLLLLVLLQLAGTAAAQEAGDYLEHRLTVGRVGVLRLEEPVVRVALGDQRIATVTILDPTELLLNSRATGRTNLLVWYADGTIDEMLLLVELDLEPLRRNLALLPGSVQVEMSSDGEAVLLLGSVPSFDVMNAVVDLVTRYLEGAAGSAGAGVVLSGSDSSQSLGGGGTDVPEGEAEIGREQPSDVSTRIRNLLVVEQLPETLDDRLQRVAREVAPGVTVERLQGAEIPNDGLDCFVVRGEVSDQVTLTRLLSMLDKLLGGQGNNFQVVTDESGALGGLSAGSVGGGGTGTGAGGAGGAGGGLGNSLDENVARGDILQSTNGRLVSLVLVRELPQVLVSVRIIEIDRSKARNLGVDWSATVANFDLSTAPDLARVSNTIDVMQGLGTNSFEIVDSNFLLTNVIRALENKGVLRTLAEPNLLTLSGETADFFVGGEVPVPEVTSTVTAALQGFEFRSFGVSLAVLPIVGRDGNVTLDVQPDVSDISSLTAGAPSFVRSRVSTTVRLQSGSALLIGGLISMLEQREVDQVPFFGDLPLVGALFKTTNKTQRERELAIIVVPTIVMPEERRGGPVVLRAPLAPEEAYRPLSGGAHAERFSGPLYDPPFRLEGDAPASGYPSAHSVGSPGAATRPFVPSAVPQAPVPPVAPAAGAPSAAPPPTTAPTPETRPRPTPTGGSGFVPQPRSTRGSP